MYGRNGEIRGKLEKSNVSDQSEVYVRHKVMGYKQWAMKGSSNSGKSYYEDK